MVSRIYFFFHSVDKPFILSANHLSRKSIKQTDKKVEGVVRKNLDVIKDTKPIIFKKKIMSFEEFKKNSNLKTFDEYKNDMNSAFPECSEPKHQRLYHEHCQAMYKNYVRLTKNPSDDPGKMI